MPLPTITVRDQQQVQPLHVSQMTIYKQCKIIDAKDESGQSYYIFFHNDQYLNYVRPKKVTKRSHVTHALKKGITLPAPHPLIDATLSSNPQVKKQDFNDLFKKLQTQYNAQETTLIATYFESFIKKEKLAHFIQTLFYKERRDGKWFSCYRIYHLLKDFSPNHPLVDTFSGNLDFTRYDSRYKNNDENLLAKDPIYVEKNLYPYRFQTTTFHQLTALYKSQSRWIDLIGIHITHLTKTKTSEDYKVLVALIDDHFNEEKRLGILKDLYKRGVEIEPLIQDLLYSYVKSERPEEAISLIGQHQISMEPSLTKALLDIEKKKDISEQSISPEGWRTFTLALFESEDPQASEILHEAVSSLLNNHEIPYLSKWIRPLRDFQQAKPLIENIDEMNRIAEDPNQQRRLGELFYFFHQPEKAIECMSWDMELYVEDPQPVQWLAKLYHETGMEEEHHAYKQLYIDMVKRA
ncbi:hypothetical protein [Halobacillus mangrovi]|uniref:Uncharacterized protein n=1 Tax=Halobacillus mangrovi TaxID=402384 RepID=A0A1W5ZZ10_9BACI|nr:hypothetical protein [Halobacillus mangrovi]ARI78523.1 hypothetical protein HM131_17510 [Halobacillus mangrovi]